MSLPCLFARTPHTHARTHARTHTHQKRILEADAERTFRNVLLRQDMVGLLEQVADGDYHQGLVQLLPPLCVAP
jgi:hypothetical protein